MFQLMKTLFKQSVNREGDSLCQHLNMYLIQLFGN